MASRSRRLPAGVRPPEAHPSKETLEHFARFCWTLRLDTGDRFRPRDFQLAKLEDFFAGGADPTFLEHLWVEPTGQGKSTLDGALALHHATYVVPRPRVFVLGGEAGHAQNTTNAAASFVHETGGLLAAWWDPQAHAGGRLMPNWLPGDDLGIFARTAGRKTAKKGGSSVEGKNPTLIVVEELHRHEDGGAALDTLVTKSAKAAASGLVVKVVIVTTAGTDRDSPLGRRLAQVLDVDAGAVVQTDLRPDEHYTRAVDGDGEKVAHIWAVPDHIAPREDRIDEWFAEVKKANPAEWITVRSLRRIWRSMDRYGRWMFLRQNANQWVAAGLAAIERAQFWALHREGLQIPAGATGVHVGLDRGNKWDSTAIVPVWRSDDGGPVRAAGAVILRSPRDGSRRRTRDVGRILEQMRERWPDMIIVFDRAQGGGDVAEELEEEHGLTIVDHGQGTEFDLASMRLSAYVEEAKLEWDAGEHSQIFADQVLAAVTKPTAQGRRWRGEAPDDNTEIDSFDALAMALHVATGREQDEPVPRPGFEWID